MTVFKHKQIFSSPSCLSSICFSIIWRPSCSLFISFLWPVWPLSSPPVLWKKPVNLDSSKLWWPAWYHQVWDGQNSQSQILAVSSEHQNTELWKMDIVKVVGWIVALIHSRGMCLYSTRTGLGVPLYCISAALDHVTWAALLKCFDGFVCSLCSLIHEKNMPQVEVAHSAWTPEWDSVKQPNPANLQIHISTKSIFFGLSVNHWDWTLLFMQQKSTKNHFGNSLAVAYRVKQIPFHSTIPLLRDLYKRKKYIHTSMFMIPETRSNPNDHQQIINKLWYIYKTEFHNKKEKNTQNNLGESQKHYAQW